MAEDGSLTVSALERVADGYVKAFERRWPGMAGEVVAGLRRDAHFVKCVPLRAQPIDPALPDAINGAADWLEARVKPRKKKAG